MKQAKGICGTVLAVGLFCVSLFAGAHVFAEGKGPCTDDIAKFCRDVQTDPASIIACLEEHEGELSNPCKEYEMKMEGKRAERGEDARVKMNFYRACKEDITQFCKDVDPRKQGYGKCISDHVNVLSPSCSEWTKAHKAETKKPE
jgi:hypothetical protein